MASALRRNILQIIHRRKHKRMIYTAAKSIDVIQEASLNENCILVDKDDNVIGSVSKRNCHKVNKDGTILLHRAFSVFIFNKNDEVLLQQRSSTKVTYPSHFTNACCSHPLHDIERERDGVLGAKLAAQRRLNFELGIQLNECNPEDLQYLTRLHYISPGDGEWGEHEIDYIFILHKDLHITPNSDEVSKVFYFSQDQLKHFVQNSSYPLTPWFRLISSNWLLEWWNNLHQLHKTPGSFTPFPFPESSCWTD